MGNRFFTRDELEEGELTFKPRLNRKSKQLSEQIDRCSRIEDALIRYGRESEKLKTEAHQLMIKSDLEKCTFKPEINQK